ncbi:GNAT family N-acetyltransferase [Streptomyces sp. NPDC047108]|uniref:GNAT family N-acetyltransferase n=1 Tax=Streptomyces sp. NPDC047108 TaxID=3155025 RepID=UPI0033CD8A0B
MAWTTTHDLDAFLSAAGDFLRTRPAEHTVLLSVAAALHAGTRSYGDDPPEYGWWRAADGAVRGAFLRTPPHPVLLSSMPDEAADDLAAVALRADRPTGGVNGGSAAARAYAAGWERRTGATTHCRLSTRLYRLGDLTPPEPAPPGAARPARRRDRDLLIAWIEAFRRDIDAHTEDCASAVDDRLSYGGLTLWEADGVPVSLAGVSRTVAGMVRVGPVYTPPAQRGSGYAGAVTAAISGAARGAGAAEVLLFADLANSTTNALYQRIGYRPVEDHVQLVFDRRRPV